MAAIGSTPFERGDEAEGFLSVTAAADQGLVRYSYPLPAGTVARSCAGMDAADVGGKEASKIAASGCVTANQFTWHPVSCAVGVMLKTRERS